VGMTKSAAVEECKGSSINLWDMEQMMEHNLSQPFPHVSLCLAECPGLLVTESHFIPFALNTEDLKRALTPAFPSHVSALRCGGPWLR
jgi:hypothetical protein